MYKITISLFAFTTLAACSQDFETDVDALQLRPAAASLGLPTGPTASLSANPETDPEVDPQTDPQADPQDDGKEIEDDPQWQPAYLPGGAYWMQYGEVYNKPADDEDIQAGRGEMVFAPKIAGITMLWGFGRLETNLQTLRLVGDDSRSFDDGDCTESVSVFGEGYMTSDDSFSMHVVETIVREGEDCEAMGVGAPTLDEYDYLADFTFVPAPGEEEEGATNN